jgi:hypothetical protein
MTKLQVPWLWYQPISRPTYKNSEELKMFKCLSELKWIQSVPTTTMMMMIIVAVAETAPPCLQYSNECSNILHS